MNDIYRLFVQPQCNLPYVYVVIDGSSITTNYIVVGRTNE